MEAPHAEVGGAFCKKTIIGRLRVQLSMPPIATCKNSSSVEGDVHLIELVSFHGYNGQPFKKIEYLVDHVKAVLNVLDDDDGVRQAAIFAGDFNTWTNEHLNAISVPLEQAGFTHALSWPYPGRDFALDHVFVRNVLLMESRIFRNGSDHQGVLLKIAR